MLCRNYKIIVLVGRLMNLANCLHYLVLSLSRFIFNVRKSLNICRSFINNVLCDCIVYMYVGMEDENRAKNREGERRMLICLPAEQFFDFLEIAVEDAFQRVVIIVCSLVCKPFCMVILRWNIALNLEKSTSFDFDWGRYSPANPTCIEVLKNK